MIPSGGRESRSAQRSDEREPSGSLSLLPGIAAPEALDLALGHRRRPVGVQEDLREARPEVVLQAPDGGREVDARAVDARAADVDQRRPPVVLDQDVGRALVAVNKDLAAFGRATERAVSRIDRVELAQDLAESRRGSRA